MPATRVDGRDVVVFCSNDYLGLANDPRLKAVARQAIEQYGVGSGASQLVSGHHVLHRQLEERLADWLGRERALLFSSGYLANSGVIPALVGQGDCIVSDALNHASLIDGMRLSRAQRKVYVHADVADATQLLAETTGGQRLLVSDAVFSMDGDRAPLPALAQASRESNAWLMVDDAHGLGVLGPQGAGAVAEAGLDQDNVPILMGTLGKSLGSAGAFVAGSEALIDYLIQHARSLIYSTASPPALAAAAIAAIDVAQAEPERREHLHRMVQRFRQGAAQFCPGLLESTTPIQPLVLGDAALALRVSEHLLDAGFLVTAIRPPTVPDGTARLRITLSAAHHAGQVDDLLTSLHDALRREGLCP